jgi:hypothetical protein
MEPESPFEATRLHPLRSAFDGTAQSFKSATDTDSDGHVEWTNMFIDEELLFWCTQSDKEDMW